MPHKGQAVRVDVEDAQAPRKHRAQLSRRREQRCVALALRARQNEQKRRHRRVLHHYRLSPTCFCFGQKNRDAAADGIHLLPRVMDVRGRHPRNLADAQPTIVRNHHGDAHGDVA